MVVSEDRLTAAQQLGMYDARERGTEEGWQLWRMNKEESDGEIA